MFDNTASYLAAMESDLAREMMRAEAGAITKSHADKMRTLARNTCVALTQAFGAELREQFGEFDIGSAALDLPTPSDSAETTQTKRQRRAVRLILTVLLELTELSKAAYTHQTVNFSRDTMTSDEFFTFDFVRAIRSRFSTVGDALRELRSSASDLSSMDDISELQRRCVAGDPFAVCIASNALRHSDRSAVTRFLAGHLATDEETGLRLLARVDHLAKEAPRQDRRDFCESLELSKLNSAGAALSTVGRVVRCLRSSCTSATYLFRSPKR